jgi:hypothetical protein
LGIKKSTGRRRNQGLPAISGANIGVSILSAGSIGEIELLQHG